MHSSAWRRSSPLSSLCAISFLLVRHDAVRGGDSGRWTIIPGGRNYFWRDELSRRRGRTRLGSRPCRPPRPIEHQQRWREAGGARSERNARDPKAPVWIADQVISRPCDADLSRRPRRSAPPYARALISRFRSAAFSRPSSVSNFCSSTCASSCAALASSIWPASSAIELLRFSRRLIAARA
jgi:hypothetical protein